jgi:Histidine kinase sensor domain
MALNERRLRWLGAAGAVTLIVLVCVLGVGIWRLHGEQLEAGRERSRAAARSAERMVAGVADKIDLALLDLAQRYREASPHSTAAQAALQARLAERHAMLDLPLSLSIFDAQGDERMDAGGDPKPVSIADRQYFSAHRSNRASGLLIDGPLPARRSARPIVIFSRRLEDPQGLFAGVVVACLPAEVFERALAEAPLGAHGALVLLRGDSTVLAQVPPAASAQGTQEAFDAHLLARQVTRDRSGTLASRATLDGRIKLLSYQRVHKYPLIVAALLDRDAALAPWWHTAWSAGGAVAAAAGAGLALFGLFARSGRRPATEREEIAGLRRRTQELGRRNSSPRSAACSPTSATRSACHFPASAVRAACWRAWRSMRASAPASRPSMPRRTPSSP